MGKMSKKQLYAHHLEQGQHLFACPICQSEIKVENQAQFICDKRHSFDIAKQGYINFLNKPFKTQYDKTLFEARQHILTNTYLYHNVTKEIAQLIRQHVRNPKPTIVDMGCGEGSHLAHLINRLPQSSVGIGFDISKEAIMTATTYNDTITCAVADIAHVPLKDAQTDVVLNFLSPSNYAEFNRMIKEDGIIVKIIPNKRYLQEIREALFSETKDEQTYSNEAVVQLFHETYDVIAQETIHEVHHINQATLQDLIKMTPLTWSASEEELKQLAAEPIDQITIDLDILVGKKKQ